MSVSRSARSLARETAAAFDFDVVTDAPVLKSRKPEQSAAARPEPDARRDPPELAKA
jgi:hypothetical protein